jgi:hypothetical protein
VVQLPSGRWISEKDPGYPFLAAPFQLLGIIRLAPLFYGALGCVGLFFGARRWLGRFGGAAAVGLFCSSGAALLFAWRDYMPTFTDAYQKSGCELAVAQAFGVGRFACLRPGVVLGPREYVGRLPWWLRRVAAGGRVLAPGSPDRSIQPVDVRDLAAFALAGADPGVSGTFNVAAPIGGESFGGMLRACADVTGSGAEFVWVPDDRLAAQGVRQWSELPLWRTFRGVWQVDSGAAMAAGLSCRPLAATVADTWAWLQGSGGELDEERAGEIGMSRERERQVLASIG